MGKPVKIENPSLRARRIPSAGVSPHKKPILGPGATNQGARWGFSFQYWKQIDNFGFSGRTPNWFISLLERLGEISKIPLKQLRTDSGLKDSVRIHRIDWTQTNIPIKREDLTWLPTDFLENQENYPILQFSISTALGRIAGFWDGDIFNIILIDPHHNLQPTKSSNHRVTHCSAAPTEMEIILANLTHIQNSTTPCTPESCSIKPSLNLIKSQHQPHGIVYIKEEYADALEKLIAEGRVKSLDECIELTILRKSCE